jgi:hypothetical protein
VDRYLRSGLALRQFSRLKGIGEQSLRTWVGKLNLQDGTTRDGTVGFVEVPSNDRRGSGASSKRGFSIHFPEGSSIEVFPETDRDLLAWLLNELRKPA